MDNERVGVRNQCFAGCNRTEMTGEMYTSRSDIGVRNQCFSRLDSGGLNSTANTAYNLPGVRNQYFMVCASNGRETGAIWDLDQRGVRNLYLATVSMFGNQSGNDASHYTPTPIGVRNQCFRAISHDCNLASGYGNSNRGVRKELRHVSQIRDCREVL